jgi:protein-S-isoprenylcysteine O-methyltransferase Ste14
MISRNRTAMNPAALSQSRLSQVLIGAIMACAWSYFAVLHVRAFNLGGDWTYLVFCITESLTALLFMVRSNPVSVSPDPRDWAVAVAGTFFVFLFLPSNVAVLPQAKVLVFIGALGHLSGMLSLNRSFGLVPATRVIKTRGMYRFIRHPLYCSYLVTFSGYLLTNSSLRNLAVFAISMVLLAIRIQREERHLAQDSDYRAYMSQVKFRVVPFVF